MEDLINETETLQQVNEVSKRPITDKEFEELKNSIYKIYSLDNFPIPTFNQDWKMFTKNQQSEIRNIVNREKESQENKEKIQSLFWWIFDYLFAEKRFSKILK